MPTELPAQVPRLVGVLASDFDAMVALRINALQESLERLGRFDPSRARERLADAFAPAFMRHIEVNGERVGFVTLRPDERAQPPSLRLHHLYIHPAAQSKRTGAWALDWAKAEAVKAGRDITLSALKQSDANRFYLRHGFVEIGQRDFDVDYRWYVSPVAAAPVDGR
jgi:GNAT superfamily N-acetyltransferase